jgi:4-hydroxy-tetrahydrodipicolinate reductase
MSEKRLKVAVIGHGRMGRLVEAIALERGHRVGAVFAGPGAPATGELEGHDVAIEFTRPEAARANLERCLEAGVPVVTGTTGWAGPEEMSRLRAVCESSGTGLLFAPNFAIGVFLFRRIVQRAAELIATDELFDLWIEESHHRGKADWPSGTALALANDALARLPRKTSIRHGAPDGPARPEELLVSSSRGGHEPGLHRVLIDAPDETIELVHRARSRRVFASGAVRAAEWLAGRDGFHSLADFLDPEETRA